MRNKLLFVLLLSVIQLVAVNFNNVFAQKLKPAEKQTYYDLAFKKRFFKLETLAQGIGIRVHSKAQR